MPFAIGQIEGKRCHWLLDVRIGGADYRYSDEAVGMYIPALATTFVYVPGLGDLVVDVDDSPTSVSIELPGTNPDGVAWARQVARGGPSVFGGGFATLRRWYEDMPWNQAQVLISGPISSPEYGSAEEGLTFTIERVGAEGGLLFPPASALVDDTTWPVDTDLTPDPYVTGARYPWVFGYPGLNDSATWAGTSILLTQPATPGYLVEYSEYFAHHDSSKLVIAGHRVLQEEVVVTDVSGGDGYVSTSHQHEVRSTFTVDHQEDLRGREVSFVQLSSFSSGRVEFVPGHEYWITWTPTGNSGGYPDLQQTGPMRGAADILALMLRETGVRVDAGKMNAIKDIFNAFHLDFSITEQVNPVDWFDEHVGQFVPYIWRESEDGIYISPLNYGATANVAVMNLVESLSTSDSGVPVTRTSLIQQSDPTDVVNDLTVRYGAARGEDLLQTVRMSARGLVHVVGVSDPTVANENPSLLCTVSQTRYGVRQEEKECWVASEIATVVNLMTNYLTWKSVARRAFTVSGGLELDSLDLGSIVTYTDDGLSLLGAPAIVVAMSLGIDDIEMTLELLDSPLNNYRSTGGG